MSVEVVARVSQRTLANVVIEESNLMVQPGVIAIVAFEILCVFCNETNIFQLIITLLLIIEIG